MKRIFVFGPIAAVMLWLAIGPNGGGLVPGMGRGKPVQASRSVNGEAVTQNTAYEEPGVVVIDESEDGHFYVDADVEGTSITAMIDTGASGVALTYEDAQDIGIDVESLNFDKKVRTAGGVTEVATVTLDEITVEDITVNNVRAVVMPEGVMDTSLIGMSFLSRLSSFRVEDGQMILEKR